MRDTQMSSSLANAPIALKIVAVIIGAIFSLTLTGDIDKDGKLKLSFGVLVKVTFSALLGFLGGDFLIEYFKLQSWSHSSHGLIMMVVSVFGMLLIGIVYQSIQLTLYGKEFSEIVSEIKEVFKSVIK